MKRKQWDFFVMQRNSARQKLEPHPHHCLTTMQDRNGRNCRDRMNSLQRLTNTWHDALCDMFGARANFNPNWLCYQGYAELRFGTSARKRWSEGKRFARREAFAWSTFVCQRWTIKKLWSGRRSLQRCHPSFCRSTLRRFGLMLCNRTFPKLTDRPSHQLTFLALACKPL